MSRKYNRQNNLVGEVLATVIHEALKENPELIHRMFSEDGNISDDEIFHHLRTHNDSKLAQARQSLGGQPRPAAPSAEPVQVQIAPRGKKRIFDGASRQATALMEHLKGQT